MNKLFTYLLSAMIIFAVGCEKFDDSAIWEKLNSLESRIAALEQLCRQMNTNISSLQTIVDALQNKDYVTNISPITEDGKVIGYTITFSKSGAITIYHGKDGKDGQNGTDGKDGKDGYTPVIGIAKDTDGIYYWTLDGNWLLDTDGNKVKAVGVDGKDGTDGKDGENGTDGKDGVTPKLKIENGYWFVSYDNGANWIELGKATGEDGENGKDGADGDSMFKDITYDNEYVYITLTDGSQLVIPRYNTQQPEQKPKNNQIWYANGSATEATTPYKTDVFGVNIISNEYDSEKEHWVITFDSDVTSIGDYAFRFCKSLTSVTIPNSVTTIGDYAFNGCSSLTSFYGKFASADNRCLIIDGVLRSSAPAGLTTYTIPDNVTKIGNGAFSGCTNLTNITIPDSVTEIGYSAFYGCSSLASITIPNSVTFIGGGSFNQCSSLTSVTLPNNITSINGSTFMACSSLTNITIPNSVVSIGANAFYECNSLTSITIPKNVTEIEGTAFYKCSNLKSVYCTPTTPPTLNYNSVFGYNASGRKIYVPTASVDAYKSASNWSKYSSNIEGYDF